MLGLGPVWSSHRVHKIRLDRLNGPNYSYVIGLGPTCGPIHEIYLFTSSLFLWFTYVVKRTFVFCFLFFLGFATGGARDHQGEERPVGGARVDRLQVDAVHAVCE